MIKVFAHGWIDAEPKVTDLGSAQCIKFKFKTKKSWVPKDSNKVYEWWFAEMIRKDISGVLPHITKGQEIVITDGEMENHSYINKEGKEVWVTSIRIGKFDFAGPKKGENTGQSTYSPATTQQEERVQSAEPVLDTPKSNSDNEPSVSHWGY